MSSPEDNFSLSRVRVTLITNTVTVNADKKECGVLNKVKQVKGREKRGIQNELN